MDIEQMRIRMGEMAAEIERLQSVIDEANAQQSPWLRAIDEALVVHHVGVVDDTDDYEQAKQKINLLLCAQQSPAVAVQICDECDISECRHVKNQTLQIIANQSPRITEQDAREIVQSFEDFSEEGESAYKDSRWSYYIETHGRALLEKLNKPDSVGG